MEYKGKELKPSLFSFLGFLIDYVPTQNSH
jgi:hypothetical protein